MTCRRSFCETRAGVAVRVIAELAEHPGAEDGPESWQGADDLGVWVCSKFAESSSSRWPIWATISAITAALAATKHPWQPPRRGARAARRAAPLGSRRPFLHPPLAPTSSQRSGDLRARQGGAEGGRRGDANTSRASERLGRQRRGARPGRTRAMSIAGRSPGGPWTRSWSGAPGRGP